MNPYDQIEKTVIQSENLDDMARCLFGLLNGDFAVWTDGSLYSIRQLVSMQGGLKIEIYSNEHPPPHFHVKGGDINASFAIDDCEMISGSLDGRRLALIEWWHERSKEKLIEIWNNTRPTDCSVGLYIPKK